MKLNELSIDIPTKKINQLEKKGYKTVEDILRIEPKGYMDYSTKADLKNAVSGTNCAFELTLKKCVRRMGNKVPYVKAYLEDSIGDTLVVTYFDQYLYGKLCGFKDKKVFVAGKFERSEWGNQMSDPDILEIYTENSFRIYPLYKKITGMSNDYFLNILNHAIDEFDEDDFLSYNFKEKFNIADEKDFIKYLHRPQNIEEIQKAIYRLTIESLYPFCKSLVDMADECNKKSKIKPDKLDLCHKVINSLPYELTPDQKAILNKFVIDAKSGKRVNALIQGDVGSGKTICSIILMLALVSNGYQAALMAPTGILAKQHYDDLEELVKPFGIKTAFLGGEIKQPEKNEILKGISNGEIDIVVGTHSVISDKVVFKNLGITVVDEEHKFGVIQREALKKKAMDGVHNISMSATPIPRSLAQTMYADSMDVYTISSMPKGRLPIKTTIVNKFNSMYAFMEKEILNGHQCYIVCPLIDFQDQNLIETESDKIYSIEELNSLTNEYFQNTNIKVAVVTGKMKEEEKSQIISDFEQNKYQILIATTIIEVGVNVPNTTVISIINAERFGLAGLHQLRGRVGRNSLQSYCMLFSEDNNNPRLEVMCKTTNGFEIAEEDLKLRGTGNIVGIRQSGEDKNVVLMLKYPKLFNAIKEYIKNNKEGR